MAEDGSWVSILEHGLLSTSALLSKWECSSAERERLESQWRKQKEPIYHPVYGKAVIRDQKVMPPGDLELCLLEDLTPQDWYRFINRKIFFWATWERLEWFLAAQAYQNQPHLVITVSTKALVVRYTERITLTDRNTGSTLFRKEYRTGPRPRGKGTFRAIEDYPDYTVGRIVELAVDDGVPDIANVTVSVAKWIAHRRGYSEIKYEHLEDIWPET